MVLKKSAEIHFAFEVGLRAGGNSGKELWIGVPHGDATIVLTAMLIVNDKWDDLIPKAFL